MHPPATQTPILITDDAALSAWCESAGGQPLLGIDTEFERTRTYFARPALIQLCAGERIALVDPLSVGRLAPLTTLLEDPDMLKILHACGEDLEVLRTATGVSPEPVFDLQVGAALAGFEFSVGYRKLALLLLDVEISKDETRSNWLRRPLRASQLEYAAADVAHLLPMHDVVSGRLEQFGRSGWMAEEMPRITARALEAVDPESAYLRIREAWRLDDQGLNVLQALCAWREREARARDRARRFVLDDAVLMALSASRPATSEALTEVQGLVAGQAAREAGAWLPLIAEACRADGERKLARPPAPVDLRPHAGTIKRLQAVVRARADALGIAPQVLAQRRQLERLAYDAASGREVRLPEAFDGWRGGVIGVELLSVLDADPDAR